MVTLGAKRKQLGSVAGDEPLDKQGEQAEPRASLKAEVTGKDKAQC